MTAAIAKTAAAILSDRKARKKLGWLIAAVFSPLLLLIAVICALALGGARTNANVVDLCWHGGALPGDISDEYRVRIIDTREAFREIDAAAAALTAGGKSADANEVKAVYFTLFFGAENGAATMVDAAAFTECFADADMETAYANLAETLGITVADGDKANIWQLLARVRSGGDSFSGGYERGGDKDTELDVSGFVDPAVKNNLDLVAFVTSAWENGWGYVWGTFGGVLTGSALESKLEQYPDEVGGYEDFIRSNWLGGRTADCVGLIKAYGWYDPISRSIRYNTSAFPDVGANAMKAGAAAGGEIASMPDVPGLAVWHKGHIGVYVGNGEVIEAMGTKYGVVKTKLSERSWTHWLEISNITYLESSP
ncbi:MAG: hypothetical protein LBJ99_01990, partial [Oscillospiraceae bacterium]|nr:hypothetical protein [Oscillospiraceae bacterium]